MVSATLTGSAVKASEHGVWLLLIAADGTPASVTYGESTTRVTDASGVVTGVNLAVPATLSGNHRALVLVDTSVVARGSVSLP
jgi:hypothetical protein